MTVFALMIIHLCAVRTVKPMTIDVIWTVCKSEDFLYTFIPGMHVKLLVVW